MITDFAGSGQLKSNGHRNGARDREKPQIDRNSTPAYGLVFSG
jgi:hypothetical protein